MGQLSLVNSWTLMLKIVTMQVESYSVLCAVPCAVLRQQELQAVLLLAVCTLMHVCRQTEVQVL